MPNPRKNQIIYRIVKQIPAGKVATYGIIAKSLGFKAKSNKRITPRMVGIALHKNPDPKKIPCHRVVNSEGRLAEGFAFGGKNKQRELLLKEGVKFKSKYVVDLQKCLWENFT